MEDRLGRHLRFAIFVLSPVQRPVLLHALCVANCAAGQTDTCSIKEDELFLIYSVLYNARHKSHGCRANYTLVDVRKSTEPGSMENAAVR
jgi:hypothetical protein